MGELIEHVDNLPDENPQPRLFTLGFIKQFAHAKVNNKFIVKDVALVCEVENGTITTGELIHVFRRNDEGSYFKVGEIPNYTLKIWGKPEKQVHCGNIFGLHMDNATSGFRGEVAIGDYLATTTKP